jgi:hypothetical protein
MSVNDDCCALQSKFRRRWLRIRLSTVIGLVVVIALMMAVWTHERQAYVPWHRNGGMIGWTDARIVAQLGRPARAFDEDVADPVGHHVRPSPPTGPFRTLIFQTIDGQFVAWFSGADGSYKCFRSTWIERNTYY